MNVNVVCDSPVQLMTTWAVTASQYNAQNRLFRWLLTGWFSWNFILMASIFLWDFLFGPLKQIEEAFVLGRLFESCVSWCFLFVCQTVNDLTIIFVIAGFWFVLSALFKNKFESMKFCLKTFKPVGLWLMEVLTCKESPFLCCALSSWYLQVLMTK